MEKEPHIWDEIEKLIPQLPSLEKESITEAYKLVNFKAFTESLTAHYMNYPRIGAENYLGNKWLIWWYERNLNIFANVASLLEGKDNERLLLLIGASHKGILEGFIRDSKKFEICDVLDIL